MKVYPHVENNSAGNMNMALNQWKLEFKNRQTEASFQKYLKKKRGKLIIKSKYNIFQLCNLIVLIIYTIAYLIQLNHNTDQRTLIFQMILIIFCILLSSFLYFNRFKMKNKIEKHYLINYFSCILTNTTLILNDFYFQRIIFDTDTDNDLNLNCLPGIISISLFYIQDFPITYLIAIPANLLTLFLYSLFRLYQLNKLSSGLLEIFILFAVQIYQIGNIYLSDLSVRNDFISKKLRRDSTESEKIIQFFEGDKIDFRLQDSIEELHNILPLLQENLKYPIEKTIGLLNVVASGYKNNFDPHLDIEKITKGLDEEDKMYIQQS